MCEAFKNFVADLASGNKQTGSLGDPDIRVATAALLAHAAAIDGAMSDAGRDKLQSLLKQRFALDDAAAAFAGYLERADSASRLGQLDAD